MRVNRANAAARSQPVRDGFINAVQVYPFSGGALYQVYAAPGEITDIALQDGEQLVGSGPVAAGDTVRWIIGDTESGAGPAKRSISSSSRRGRISRPISSSTPTGGPISWSCARRRKDLYGVGLLAISGGSADRLRRQNVVAEAAAPVASGVDISKLNFRYEIEGDNPAWRPMRAFDDGRRSISSSHPGSVRAKCRRSSSSARRATSELVNYRVRQNYYIVDRLFAAAEFRLGDKDSERRVRIVRTDGRPRA